MSLNSGPGFGQAPLLFENLVWLNSEEAAEYLRMSVGALRTALCRGQIGARKWRRRLYFQRAELDRLLETSRIKRGNQWR